MSLNKVIATGSYVGNGSTTVVSIGWRPAQVMIFSTRTTGPGTGRALSVRSDTQPGSNTLFCDTGVSIAVGITMTATGFSVNSDDRINRSGETFHWLAFRNFASALTQQSYIGDGAPSQNISLGLSPTVGIIVAVTPALWLKWPSMGTQSTVRYNGSTALLALTSEFVAGGVDVGGGLNNNLITYHPNWIYQGDGSTRHVQEGTYTGNAGINSVTLGRQPKSVYIYNSTSPLLGFKTASMAGADLGELGTGWSWAPAGGVTITSIGFNLDPSPNWNGAGNTYRYMALFD